METGEIREVIEKDVVINSWRESGWCRRWSVEVIRLLESLNLFVKVEAREVEIAPDHWHTFVFAVDGEGLEYLFINNLNGLGTYIGGTENFEELLKASRIDGLLMSNIKAIDIG